VDPDTLSVIERLEAYNQRFEELLAMLRGSLPLRGADKDKAQALYKSLKTDLEAEYRKMSTVRGQEALTDVERSCYAPVIHQTFTELYSPTNAVPDAKLHGHLYGARINITHMLHQLQRDG
jgi:hypothetical protein